MSERVTPIEHPTDPTPMTVRWKLYDGGEVLVGTEWPSDPKHMDRLAGTMVLDAGEWRKIRRVAFELPTDIETALTIRDCRHKEAP